METNPLQVNLVCYIILLSDIKLQTTYPVKMQQNQREHGSLINM